MASYGSFPSTAAADARPLCSRCLSSLTVVSLSVTAVLLVLVQLPQSTSPPPPSVDAVVTDSIGGQQDTHGCYLGGGYTWCESLGKCVRLWEIKCPAIVTEASVYQSWRDSDQRLAPMEPLKLGGAGTPDQGTVITLDTNVKYQEILGFGGAFTESAAFNINLMRADKQEEILRAYFGSPDTSLGYTLCRSHINSVDFSLGSYSCDDTADDFQLLNFDCKHDQQFLLPLIKRALVLTAAGGNNTDALKLFASPWSPPAWMKGNGDMDGSSLPGLRDDAAVHHAWALYLSKFVSYYHDHGVDFWGMTVQNEPANAAPWEACVYTAEQERDFVKNHLGPQLLQDHPDLKIIIWDHNRDAITDWAQTILGDPEAAKYVAGTGYHWYEGNSPSLRHYEALTKTHQVDPSKFVLATEATYCPGVSLHDWRRGEAYGHDILNGLRNWGAGWVDWNIVLDTTGGPNHLGNMCDSPIIVDPATQTITYQPMYYFIGHFSKFVRPGDVRILSNQTQGLQCRLRPSATDSSQVCTAVTWACGAGVDCALQPACTAANFIDRANDVFDRWYQSQEQDQGPYACDFGGIAVLEGLQSVAFAGKGQKVVVVLLNMGDTAQDFTVHFPQGVARGSVPEHSIQTVFV